MSSYLPFWLLFFPCSTHMETIIPYGPRCLRHTSPRPFDNVARRQHGQRLRANRKIYAWQDATEPRRRNGVSGKRNNHNTTKSSRTTPAYSWRGLNWRCLLIFSVPFTRIAAVWRSIVLAVVLVHMGCVRPSISVASASHTISWTSRELVMEYVNTWIGN